MTDLTFPELQQKMQLSKQKKQGISYSFRNIEDITTKFKELDSGWILKFEDCDPIDIQGRLFYKSVAIASKGDETHRSPGYAELSEVPVINTKKGTTIQQMQTPQWTGAISSYARKYAVQGLFAIGEKDVDEYPVEENQRQPAQNNQQGQVQQNRYIDKIQYQEIIKSVEEFATVKGAPFDTVANFVMSKYQIQDFHEVPVGGYNVVMEYLNTQIQKAYKSQGV